MIKTIKNHKQVFCMFAILLLVASLMFVSAGCGQNKPADKPGTENPATKDEGKPGEKPGMKEPGKEPAKPGEPVKNGDSLIPADMQKPEKLMKSKLSGFELQRAEAQFLLCRSNEQNLGTALEMYSTDNAGKYPDKLSQLSPDYLRAIPTCAAAGKDTYSETYITNKDNTAYFFYCKGKYHEGAGAPANFPRYSSEKGAILPVGYMKKYNKNLSPESKVDKCVSNLKNIQTALEMYTTDHQGKYPKSLDEIAPAYIREIPQCPAAEKDTYSPSYSLKEEGGMQSYKLYCKGHYHKDAGLKEDYPRYEYGVGIKKQAKLTDLQKKQIKVREAMEMSVDVEVALAKKDYKKAREILEKLKKLGVSDSKSIKTDIDKIEKILKEKGF